MGGFQNRLTAAASHVEQAEVVLDEVERGLERFQDVEIEVRRSGTLFLVAGAVLLGAAVVVGVSGFLLRRWLTRPVEAEGSTELSVGDARTLAPADSAAHATGEPDAAPDGDQAE